MYLSSEGGEELGGHPKDVRFAFLPRPGLLELESNSNFLVPPYFSPSPGKQKGLENHG